MYRCSILALLILFTIALKGQYDFKNLRYNEDFSFLKNDTSESWYKKFKFRQLRNNDHITLSNGGEVRYQVQHFTNEDWGEVPVKSYTAYYTRFLFHSDLHLGKRIRIFNQFNSTFAVGRVTPVRMIDQNELDIHQIFLDLKLSKHIKFRVGRQELLYGSQRIISVREGPNNRQSFDAVKWSYTTEQNQFDCYYGIPVRIQLGSFNDAINDREQIWSVNWMRRGIRYIHNLDVYYIGFQSDEKAYDAGEENELRNSFGLRIWRKSKKLNYDFEALYQLGSWGVNRIHAYTASLDVSYSFSERRRSPQVGLKTEFISGDKNREDGRLNSFNPLYPRGAYFGLAALIGPVNLVDFHPSMSVMINDKTKISWDYDAFWRYSVNDGIYGPNVQLTFGSESTEKFIGNQFGCALEWQPNDFITMSPEVMYFIAGPYLKDVSSGLNVFFSALTFQLKY